MEVKRNQIVMKQKFIQTIDKKLPLKLNNFEEIVNRCHELYPLCSKPEIALIIKALIEQMRVELLSGNSITVQNFWTNLEFYPYYKLYRKTNKIAYNVKLRASTPEKVSALVV